MQEPANDYEQDYQLINSIRAALDFLRENKSEPARYEISGACFEYDLSSGKVTPVSSEACGRVNNVFSQPINDKLGAIVVEAIAVYSKLTLLERIANEVTQGELGEKIKALCVKVYEDPGDIRVAIMKVYDNLSFTRRGADIFAGGNDQEQQKIISALDQKKFAAVSCLNDANDIIEQLLKSASAKPSAK